MRYNFRLKNTALLIVITATLWQLQAQNANGVVLLPDGKPVVGAVVFNTQNPSKRVLTDKNGFFSVIADVNEVIQIETADYNNKRIQFDGKVLEIKLDYSASPIPVGYGNVTYLGASTQSAAVVNGDAVMQSTSLSTDGTLYGKLLGLTALQRPGLPWESKSNLFIRGLSSLQSNSMLVLIDGFERPLNDIHKEEIASVTVLKDASALAMYGFRGANGVLLVTTRRGRYSSTNITFSYEKGSTAIKERPQFVNSHDYAVGMNEAYRYDGSSTVPYSQQQLDAYRNGTYPAFYPNVDWYDEIFKNNGETNNYNLSIRGGGQHVRYFTNINVNDESGFIKPASTIPNISSQLKYSNLNIRTNLDIKVTPTTDLEVKLLGRIYEYNRPGRWYTDDVLAAVYHTPAGAYPIQHTNEEWGGHELWSANPYAAVTSSGFSNMHSRTMFADMALKQDLSAFVSGLTADVRVAFDNSGDYADWRHRQYRVQKVQLNLNPDGTPADTVFLPVIGQNTTLSVGHNLASQWRRINIFGRLNYVNIWGNNAMQSSLMFMQERINNNGQHQTFYRQNYIGTTHFSHNNRYFADATFTVSGSNRLAPGNRYGFFPAVSGAWLLSNEDFFASKNVDFLKLRASWGINGSDYTPEAELYRQSFSGGGSYYFTDNYTSFGSLREGRLATLMQTYEKSYKSNIALEGLLFKHLGFTVEAFLDQRRDILVSTFGSNSAVLGASNSFENSGMVDNKGLEFELTYEREIGDFKYALGGQLTYYRSKVLEMGEGPVPYDYLRATGQPVGQIFGYEAIGFFRDQAEIDAAPIHRLSEVSPGDIRFKDQNGDNMINELDRIALGYNNVVPEIYYSANIHLEYKGFGISALLQGTGNYSAILNTKSLYRPLTDNANISQYYFDNRWTEEKSIAGITPVFPRLSMEKNDNNFSANSVWLADRSYVKLRNLEVFYNLSDKLLRQILLKQLKVYVRANDLFTHDRIEGADAEALGVHYPMSRSVNMGVIVGF